jgi:Serine/threonine protein kinase
LNHPNIVAVYDTGEDTLIDPDGQSVVVPYIVMEYVDGMTLRQLLASGRRLLPERALEIAARVLAALDYATGTESCTRHQPPRHAHRTASHVMTLYRAAITIRQT